MSQRRSALKSFQTSTLTDSKQQLQNSNRTIITTRTNRSKLAGDTVPASNIASKVSDKSKKSGLKIDKKSQDKIKGMFTGLLNSYFTIINKLLYFAFTQIAQYRIIYIMLY